MMRKLFMEMMGDRDGDGEMMMAAQRRAAAAANATIVVRAAEACAAGGWGCFGFGGSFAA